MRPWFFVTRDRRDSATATIPLPVGFRRMAPRLKVFTWSDGFHAFTVATSSRPKALQAWGVSQDLFKSGLARQIEGGPDHDAALKSPGQVIERGLSIDPGEIKPARKPKGPSAASRRKVEALEAELAELDERQAEEADALEAEAKALAKRQADLEKRHGSERDRLRNRLKAARDKV
jgi:hypothetical protein